MESARHNLSLDEAARHFLVGLSDEERGASQPEIYKFVRWFGGERPLAELTATEVVNYSERLPISDTDYLKKLEWLRAWLIFAKKKGWTKSNLAVHLKARKGKTRRQSLSRSRSSETVFLTRQGYADLENELTTLRSKRVEVIEETRRAAADKDFRENAPLEAAREQHGQLEGRIMELEQTLKSAVIIDDNREVTLKVSIGDSVVLSNLDSGEELPYTLVSPREADPIKGKISSASPVGQAIMARGRGEIVEVIVPMGKRRYQIKQIKR